MQKSYAASLFLAILVFSATAQKPETPVLCWNTPEDDFALRAEKKVRTQKEWETDKASGSRKLVAIREFETHGCLTKTWYPCGDNPVGGKYAATVYRFSSKGFKTGFSEIWFDKDSVAVIHHDEQHLLDSLNRYYESHYVYNDPRPGLRPFDHEDLYHRYDLTGYSIVTRLIRRKGADSLQQSTFYFKDEIQAEPVRTEVLYYGANRRLHVMDEKKRPVEIVEYGDAQGRTEKKHSFYEYNDQPGGGMLLLTTRYELVNGKKMRIEVTEYYPGNRSVRHRFQNDKLISTSENLEPVADGPRDETGSDLPVQPQAECLPKTSTVVNPKGIKTVTTWLECPSPDQKKDIYMQKFLPGGLLIESNLQTAATKTVYEYTYFK